MTLWMWSLMSLGSAAWNLQIGADGAFVMSQQFQAELNSAKIEQSKIEKRIRLLEELIALESEHGMGAPAPAAVSKEAPRRKPRPERRGGDAAKPVGLTELLLSIGSQSTRPLTIEEISQMVMAGGYKSKSDNPGMMIYQTLFRLCKRGVFEKNIADKSYRFVGAAGKNAE